MVFDLVKISAEVKEDTLGDISLKFDQVIEKGSKCRFAV